MMFYLVHLAFPALVTLAIFLNSDFAFNADWQERAWFSFSSTYLVFAIPHLLWASLTAYFEVSKVATIGGFIGAHMLLVGVTIWVMTADVPESANGWLLYMMFWPFAIALGAFIASKSRSLFEKSPKQNQ
jgi:hypothetical protein